jgi:hypothetical protein
MLLFKRKFLDAIRSGEKTQTVRLWKACRFRTGQRSYIPGVGYIRILDVARVRLETDEDARLDGFPSAEALMIEIQNLYPDRLREGFQAYRLRFRRMDDAEAQAERGEKKRSVVRGQKSDAAARPITDP